MTRPLFAENAPAWLCVTAGSRFSTRARKVGGGKKIEAKQPHAAKPKKPTSRQLIRDKAPAGYQLAVDAWRATGCSPKSVFMAIKRGLPSLFIEGHRYIRIEDALAYKARMGERRKARGKALSSQRWPERQEA